METPIAQIALSVGDIETSRRWYQEVGLESSGGMGPLSGDFAAQMLGLPELEVNLGWMLGRDPMSQLELIHFSRPVPRPLQRDWSPRVAGYGIVSIVVADFAQTLGRLRAAGSPVAITGSRNSQSIWTRDPDGVIVEILERDPLGFNRDHGESGTLASLRAVSLTVNDLTMAKRYWTSAVGLVPCAPLTSPFDDFPEAFNAGVDSWDQELLRGGRVVVRLLQPHNATVLPKPPGWRLCDLGVLNIAAIVDDSKRFTGMIERTRKLGYKLTTDEPMAHADHAAAIYGYDDQNNSVEMGFVLPGYETRYGWKR